MTAYYNEIDPYAAEWLRNLIAAGEIAPGDVDERSIEEVSGDDLRGYVQCHFFAGIGGWSSALRQAGWDDERPVWSGSCPCQPLSSAGQHKGHADQRHLWPAFYRLISTCRPSTILGEQVASRDGREWFAGVRTDLGELGYACGAADMPAASVGAPHIRQRLWWVAHTTREQMGDAGQPRQRASASGGGVANAPSKHGRAGTGRNDRQKVGNASGLGNADGSRWHPWGTSAAPSRHRDTTEPASCWIDCADGKARRVEPGIHPLAHGVSNRVGRLRAYGNAIVPQVAAEFIRAFEEVNDAVG